MEQEGDLVRVANVNAGDLIGDMGVLLQVPRTASIRSDTYMHVLRIPGFLFREAALWLGIFSEEGEESLLRQIWRRREIVQASHLFGAEVPLYLQNRIARHAREIRLAPGETAYPCAGSGEGLVVGREAEAFVVDYQDQVLLPEASAPPVFGEKRFLEGTPEAYRVTVRRETDLLCLDRERFEWVREVPIFRLRLSQLIGKRSVFVRRAGRS